MQLLREDCPEKLKVEEIDENEVVSAWIKRDLKNIKENKLNGEMAPFLNSLVSAWVSRDLGKITKIIAENWNDN